MTSRIIIIKNRIGRALSFCYADQYAIADFVEQDSAIKKRMDELTSESEMYKIMLKLIEEYEKGN